MTAAICILPLVLLGAALGHAAQRWAERAELEEYRRWRAWWRRR